MPTPLFYIFAVLMIIGGIAVVALRNPVSSALSMVVSFIGLAALLIGLNAYFLGVLQVLVYAGAIMVLFIFIIMLLDFKKEDQFVKPEYGSIVAAVVIPLMLVLQIAAIITTIKSPEFPVIDKHSLMETEALLATEQPKITSFSRDENDQIKTKEVLNSNYYSENSTVRKELRDGNLPDVNLIGQKLFTQYHFPIQVVALLLVVATVGCVTLSKKSQK